MASVVLIIASLVSPLIRFFLMNGPELAMNISSLAIRDNPHVLLPDSGTFLDAADRARLVRDIKVRFGDLDGENQIGRLAISSCGDPNHLEALRMLRVFRGRFYH